MSSINVCLVFYKSPTSAHVAIYTPETSRAVLNMPCFSTLWYFCSFVPSIKNVQICLVNTSPPLKAQLKRNLSRTPFRMLPSRGETRPLLPPKDHHSSLQLWWLISLSADLSCVEHVTTGPLYYLGTGPARRGNSRESVLGKTNDCRTQRLCFPPMYISNTSPHSVLDNQRANPSRK